MVGCAERWVGSLDEMRECWVAAHGYARGGCGQLSGRVGGLWLVLRVGLIAYGLLTACLRAAYGLLAGLVLGRFVEGREWVVVSFCVGQYAVAARLWYNVMISAHVR